VSGNVIANIKSIVDNLDNVEWKQTIYEAVTNSLQAEATNIDIKFMSDTLDYNNTKKRLMKLL
jgi:transcription antitermination factor NusA-like protein